MVAYRVFRPGILVVFVFILLTGLTAAAQYQEKTTETSKMDQGSAAGESGYVPQTHTIILTNNAFNPETTEINQYDTVIWRNLEKPKKTVILESGNNLWEDFNLGYGKSFEYTFNETGTFGFNIKGESDLKGTVVVKAGKTTGGVAPSSGNVSRNQTQQRETEQQEEEVTPTPAEKVTPIPTKKVITPAEQVQVSEKSVVIRGSVFYPETLELKKGETLVFKNLNKPKRSFTLVSDEGLFEDQSIGYGRSFSYTFEKAGDYTFKLKEISDSKLTIKVK